MTNVASNIVNAFAASDIQISDPIGDFLSTYVGPKGGVLDVVKAQVTFTGTEFVFYGTMDAPIGTTAVGFYVFGVDRVLGSIVASCAQLNLTDILFDVTVQLVSLG